MSLYWTPKYKWQFVDWFTHKRLMSRSKAMQMKKRNLAGKYKEIRDKETVGSLFVKVEPYPWAGLF